MRAWVRIVLVVAGVVLVAAAIFLVPTIWGRPWTIDLFYARSFGAFALRHPMLLTTLGLPVPPALDFYSDKLDDLSVAAEERETRFLDRTLRMLGSYDRSRMSDEQRLSAEVMEWFLRDLKGVERFRYHNYPVNPAFGAQSELIEFLTQTHPLRRPRDAGNYVRRVERLGTAIDQVREGMEYRERRGILPPRFVLTRVLVELRAFAAARPADNVLYRHFAEKADSIPGLAGARRAELERRLAAAIAHGVYPAYGRLIALCAHQEAVATTDDGVWKLPDGDAYYAQCLRLHTSTDMSAEQIHRLGLAEVARIEAEMRRLLREVGEPAGDVGAAMRRLRTEPRFLYPDTPAGRAQVLADFQSIIDQAQHDVAPLFHLRARQGVVVRRVPEFREASAAGAYYETGAMDGSRPGIFYVNLRKLSDISRPGMRTLAYHEAIPGHHWQGTIAQEMRGLPFFRRILPFTAYAEGWGLYAERLALESGFEKTAYDSLGAYSSELFRAVRLVVDTGIHYKRWTREQAIDYLGRTTGMPETEVVAEVERYIVLPGQACAYKVGELKILELRERARRRLGPRFDLAEFHDVVLRDGALPLSILERRVNEWIARKGRTAA